MCLLYIIFKISYSLSPSSQIKDLRSYSNPFKTPSIINTKNKENLIYNSQVSLQAKQDDTSLKRTFSHSEWKTIIRLIQSRLFMKNEYHKIKINFKETQLEELKKILPQSHIDHQRSFRERHENLLEIAFKKNNYNFFKYIVEQGYPLDKPTSTNDSIFVLTIFGFNAEDIDNEAPHYHYSSLLLFHGCNIHQVGNFGSALSTVVLFPHQNKEYHKICLDYCLSHNADTEDINNILFPVNQKLAEKIHIGLHTTATQQVPPLLKAIMSNRIDFWKLLVEFGADYRKKDFNGRNTLHLIEDSKYPEFLTPQQQQLAGFLIQSGISANELSGKLKTPFLIPLPPTVQYQGYLKNIDRLPPPLVENKKAMNREKSFLTQLSKIKKPAIILELVQKNYPLPHDRQIYNYSCFIEYIRLMFIKSLQTSSFNYDQLISHFKKEKLFLDIPFLFFFSLRHHPSLNSLAYEFLEHLLSQPLDKYRPLFQKYLKILNKDLSLNYDFILPLFQEGDPYLLPFILFLNGNKEAQELKKLSLIDLRMTTRYDPSHCYRRMVHLALDHKCIPPLCQELNHKAQSFYQKVLQNESSKNFHHIDSIHDLYTLLNKKCSSLTPTQHIDFQQFPQKINEFKVYGRSLSFTIQGKEFVIKVQKHQEEHQKFMGFSVLQICEQEQKKRWGDLKALTSIQLSEPFLKKIEQRIRDENGIKPHESLSQNAYIFQVEHTHYFDYLEDTSHTETFYKGLKKNIEQTLELIKIGILRCSLSELNHDTTRRYIFGPSFNIIGFWYHGTGHIQNISFKNSNYSTEGIRDPDDFYAPDLQNEESTLSHFSQLRRDFFSALTEIESQSSYTHLQNLDEEGAFSEKNSFSKSTTPPSTESDDTDFRFKDTLEYKRQLNRYVVMPIMEILMTSYYQFLLHHKKSIKKKEVSQLVDDFINNILKVYLEKMFPSIPIEKWKTWIDCQRPAIHDDIQLFKSYPQHIEYVSLRHDARDCFLQNVYNIFSNCIALSASFLNKHHELSQILEKVNHKEYFPPHLSSLPISEKAQELKSFFQKEEDTDRFSILKTWYSQQQWDLIERVTDQLLFEKREPLIIQFIQYILKKECGTDQFTNYEQCQFSKMGWLNSIIDNALIFHNEKILHYLIYNKIIRFNDRERKNKEKFTKLTEIYDCLNIILSVFNTYDEYIIFDLIEHAHVELSYKIILNLIISKKLTPYTRQMSQTTFIERLTQKTDLENYHNIWSKCLLEFLTHTSLYFPQTKKDFEILRPIFRKILKEGSEILLIALFQYYPQGVCKEYQDQFIFEWVESASINKIGDQNVFDKLQLFFQHHPHFYRKNPLKIQKLFFLSLQYQKNKTAIYLLEQFPACFNEEIYRQALLITLENSNYYLFSKIIKIQKNFHNGSLLLLFKIINQQHFCLLEHILWQLNVEINEIEWALLQDLSHHPSHQETLNKIIDELTPYPNSQVDPKNLIGFPPPHLNLKEYPLLIEKIKKMS